MIDILIFLVIAGLIYYCITLLPLPEPFPMIIRIVVIVAIIIWLLKFVAGGFTI